MRKILFKAKCLSDGKWYQGFYYETPNGISYIRNDKYTVQVDPETVCQFTGLCDKNGNKIFDKMIGNNNEIVCYYKNYVYLCNILNGDITFNFSEYEYKREFSELSQDEKRVVNEYIQQAERTFENKGISTTII